MFVHLKSIAIGSSWEFLHHQHIHRFTTLWTHVTGSLRGINSISYLSEHSLAYYIAIYIGEYKKGNMFLSGKFRITWRSMYRLVSLACWKVLPSLILHRLEVSSSRCSEKMPAPCKYEVWSLFFLHSSSVLNKPRKLLMSMITSVDNEVLSFLLSTRLAWKAAVFCFHCFWWGFALHIYLQRKHLVQKQLMTYTSLLYETMTERDRTLLFFCLFSSWLS